MSMDTILCATDLSESARPVVAVAAGLARALGARIELLHVVHVPPGLPPEMFGDEVLRDLRDAASGVMEARAAALHSSGLDVGARVRTDLVDDGIVRHAREVGASLIVIGTHARTGAPRLFLGSVAERTVRAATCPVVVVPPGAGGRLARGEAVAGPLAIVAGIDASPASDAALAWLRAVEKHAPCDLRLVHLYWPVREHERLGLGAPDPFEADPEVVAALGRELGAHVTEHLGRDVPVRVRPSWGAEENPLAWEADVDGADLLVVGTSQARGSTALATLRGATLPVVCVPRGAPQAEHRRLPPVRTVLATTDFSPLGNAAVDEAYRLLARGGGEVVLAHVAEPGAIERDTDRREEIEACLLALVPDGADRRGIHTRTLVAMERSAADAIVKAIRRVGPDVVVMSSHGRSGIDRAVHGSVTEHVVRSSPKPVLVVPPGATAQGGSS
jgi:nucleotide-binding universal stress UspA family protein